jgi:hypothetical protein
MTPDRKQSSTDELLSDEELHRRVVADPEVQARIEIAKRRAKGAPNGEGPGITAEELPDFLRERDSKDLEP